MTLEISFMNLINIFGLQEIILIELNTSDTIKVKINDK